MIKAEKLITMSFFNDVVFIHPNLSNILKHKKAFI